MATEQMTRDGEFFGDIVYGTFDRHRYTQDSPVLLDVYAKFGSEPKGVRADILLTPDWSKQPGELAHRLQRSFGIAKDEPDDGTAASDAVAEEKSRPLSSRERDLAIAYNQSVVAVRLTFLELVQTVLPLSWWWNDRLVPAPGLTPTKVFTDERTKDVARTQLVDGLKYLIRWRGKRQSSGERAARPGGHWLIGDDLVWAAHLFFLIEHSNVPGKADHPARGAVTIANWFIGLVSEIDEDRVGKGGDDWVFSINLNREIDRSMYYSVPGTKADVVTRTFEATGRGIRWAVVDSGIDASHVAFRTRDRTTGLPHDEPFESGNNTRVKATYDFARIRDQLVQEQQRGLTSGRLLDWKSVEEKLAKTAHPLNIPHTTLGYVPPKSAHGTHVAGIIAADWDPKLDPDDPIGPPPGSKRQADPLRGMCSEIELYDLRVFDGNVGNEFAVMSALQFIRYLNTKFDNIEVHGANLSLSVFHDVRNFACGRSPVCEESTRLVSNGVVVVAAAGNAGRAVFTSEQGATEKGYRSVSIADPGNAEAVITVGSTHSRQPHAYGVSYFSSRGPTGDGRMKPDLVAPGEKILSTTPGDGAERMDGTSQAAPHVSGAAALLMSRHRELIGDPVRVKSILVETATDLGRERAYQGAGLVDVLRAMQSF